MDGAAQAADKGPADLISFAAFAPGSSCWDPLAAARAHVRTSEHLSAAPVLAPARHAPCTPAPPFPTDDKFRRRFNEDTKRGARSQIALRCFTNPANCCAVQALQAAENNASRSRSRPAEDGEHAVEPSHRPQRARSVAASASDGLIAVGETEAL